MQAHSLKTRALLLCLAFFLAGAVLLHAGGQAEPRLAEAQMLIQRQEYADALKLLATIQRDNPDLRDQTSRMMSQIRAVMQQYNGVLSELSAARAAGDVAAMERLLPELRRIDPGRSSEVTRTTTVLSHFLTLMDKADALLKAGKPGDALALYAVPIVDPAKAGFDMQAGDFEAAGYGSILATGVRGAAARIAAAVTHDLGVAEAIAAAPSALNTLYARVGSPDGVAGFDAAAAPLLDAAITEGALRSASATLEGLGATIRRSEGKGREDPYIQYLLWLCNGRQGKTEGIARAMHLLWADRAREASENAATVASAAFRRARERYLAGALDEAVAGFDDAYYRSILAVKSAGLSAAGLPLSAATGWSVPGPEMGTARTLLSHALLAQEHAAEVDGYRALVTERKALAALPAVSDSPVQSPEAAAEALRLMSARTSMDSLQNEVAAHRAEWSGRAAAWEAPVKDGIAPGETMSSAQGLADLFQHFSDADLQQRDLGYAVRIARIGGSGFAGRLSAAVALRAQGEDQRDGTQGGKAPQGQTGMAVRYPDRAMTSFSRAGADLEALIADIEKHETGLRADKPYVAASSGMEALFKGTPGNPGYDELLASAQRERDNCQTLLSGAQSQLDQAAVFSREGDNWFARALASLTKNDPDGAELNLGNASESYIKSLASAYSDHAATRTGKDQNDLNVRIQTVRNNLAIQSAQNAIAAITKKVGARDFLGASLDLDTAESTWERTQVGSYPPFDTLRQFIQNALDLSAGRDISRLDPKADVVNAFIKNPQDNLAAGRLADAERNVKDALAVAPNYGAAKVLQLMIKKQTDPVGFQKDARAQIATYVGMAGNSADSGGQKTAYLALLDYSRLDPKFAVQLKGTIQELEYSLGLARRPANPQQIRQSNQLVDRANALQQDGTQDSYQGALQLLKQALQINPDNVAAIRLDGQIRTKMGSTTLSALSDADTQRYNQALSLYLSGAYQDSYGVVLDLWDNPRSPRNKTFAPLQKLKKRLEVALNIS